MEPCAFGAIPRAVWEDLAGRNPWATPFSAWAFQRAWWDAYGGTAHEQYLCFVAEGADGRRPDPFDHPDAIRGIVPLMHRHEVEPSDAATATSPP